METNPNHKTSLSQTRAILAYLRTGQSVTDDLVRRKFHCASWRARLQDIERIVGYKLPRKMIQVQGLDCNNQPITKRVKCYWLKEEDVNNNS